MTIVNRYQYEYWSELSFLTTLRKLQSECHILLERKGYALSYKYGQCEGATSCSLTLSSRVENGLVVCKSADNTTIMSVF